MLENTINEDHSLLLGLRRGERTAFESLFRKYYPLLCTYCSRFVSLEDAEEVVQDVMVWLWNNRETFEVSTSLKHYLFKSVYRGALARISRMLLKQKADTYFYEEMREIYQSVDFYLIDELSNRIQDAIMSLPRTYRDAFVMHRFRQMSYKEIAKTMNVSVKTIDYRIQQALKRLRLMLKDYLPFALLLLL